MRRQDLPIALVAFATFVNGLVGVLQALFSRLPEPHDLQVVLPYGVHHWSRLLTLVTGLLLLDLAYHVWRRRRAAWGAALLTSSAAGLAHLAAGHPPLLALPSLLVVLLLLRMRRRFTVRSEPRSVARGVLLVAVSLVVAVAYGAIGFWRLDRSDFGIEFHWREAGVRSLRQYLLLGNPDLVPHTRHARWFLDSLDAIGVGAVIFGAFSLYRPLAFKLRTLPHERAAAAEVLRRHGRSSLDYFKLGADKSFFFAPGESSFIAYRVAWGCAVALGDPAGPVADAAALLGTFHRQCVDNGWRVAFHQVGSDFLPLYRDLGFSVLKIGEEAIVDLATFVTDTAGGREFRRVCNRAKTIGLTVTRHAPPLDAHLLDELEAISHEWLSLPGRRERGFTLGRWDRAQVGATPVFVARDADGKSLAFVNRIPCWPAGDATTDLMRHRIVMPNGTMDFLFVETLRALAGEARRFSLGLAPFAGVGDRPGAPLEERAMHQIHERLNRFFSYKGLRSYKSKFAPRWEERFLIYQGGPTGLVNAGIALTRLTEGNAAP